MRCHGERDVPTDPHLPSVFSGEEFGRGSRLWTHGYDFYALKQPIVGCWYGDKKGGKGQWRSDSQEAVQSGERLATMLQWPGSALLCCQLGVEQSVACLPAYHIGWCTACVFSGGCLWCGVCAGSHVFGFYIFLVRLLGYCYPSNVVLCDDLMCSVQRTCGVLACLQPKIV